MVGSDVPIIAMTRTTTALIVGLLVVLASVGSAGIVLAYAGATGAPTQSALQQTDSTSRTITVTASGEATAQPDTAILRISVDAADPKATVARSQVAENVSAVRAALVELGIDESKITSTGYTIYYDERRAPDSKPDEPPVYRVRHTLAIEIDDVEMVGQVIDAAVDAGVTTVQNVQFTVSEETRAQLQNEALTDAMTSARSQADTLATSAALTILSVQDVQTGSYGVPRLEYAMTAAAGGAGTDLNAGPVTVTATVSVTYDARV